MSRRIFQNFLIVILSAGLTPSAPAEDSKLPDFSAAEFFEVIYKGSKRNASFPKAVTLEMTTISKEELEVLLPGTWRGAGTCSGRPMNMDDLFYSNLANGVTLPSVAVNFYGDGRFERVLHRGILQARGDLRVVDMQTRWRIGKNEGGDFRIELVFTDIKHLNLKIARIRETNELIFADPLPLENATIPCRPGETPMQLFVKIPTS